jgi:hypothetical protein
LGTLIKIFEGKAKYDTLISSKKKHNSMNKERATWRGENQTMLKSRTSPVGALEKDDKR